mgnify:CR=1 FL=1
MIIIYRIKNNNWYLKNIDENYPKYPKYPISISIITYTYFVIMGGFIGSILGARILLSSILMSKTIYYTIDEMYKYDKYCDQIYNEYNEYNKNNTNNTNNKK